MTAEKSHFLLAYFDDLLLVFKVFFVDNPSTVIFSMTNQLGFHMEVVAARACHIFHFKSLF